MAGIGIAKKGLGLLGKKKRGNFAMKNFKKRLQKTPNKKFREDKSYTLMEGTPHAKTYQHITSGKKQKKKILQQQQSIKRNWEATGHEWGPHKGGWKAKGGRIGLQRGGGSAPFLRGRSGATNIKAPRGQQGWKQMQAAEAKIPSKGLRVVKGNPVRQDQAQRLRAHRLRTKIKGARAGRAKQAQQEAGTAKFYAKHPGAKTMFAKQKFGRQFRKAGKI